MPGADRDGLTAGPADRLQAVGGAIVALDSGLGHMSEKRVARVMREEGLEVVYNKRRARGYSSYAGEVSKAPENLVNRNFHADEPN